MSGTLAMLLGPGRRVPSSPREENKEKEDEGPVKEGKDMGLDL
jgi:hypothetical protein